MTLDLRRLAERSLADEPGTVDRLLSKENAQAILALLDERDLLRERGGIWLEVANDWAQKANNAERRVAALEELVGEIVMEYPALDPKHPWAGFVERARALLAAAPSERKLVSEANDE